MTIRSVLTGLIAACVLVAALAAEQAAPRRFGFDDFSRVRRVSDPQFSPDGATIAFVVSTPNLDENRHVASLHRVDVAGGTPQLSSTATKYVGVSFPRWAPERPADRVSGDSEEPSGSRGRRSSSSPSQRRRAQADHDGADRRAAARLVARQPRRSGSRARTSPRRSPAISDGTTRSTSQPNFHLFMTAPVPPTHVWMVPAAGGEREAPDVGRLDAAGHASARRALVDDHVDARRDRRSSSRAAAAARGGAAGAARRHFAARLDRRRRAQTAQSERHASRSSRRRAIRLRS